MYVCMYVCMYHVDRCNSPNSPNNPNNPDNPDNIDSPNNPIYTLYKYVCMYTYIYIYYREGWGPKFSSTAISSNPNNPNNTLITP